MSRHLWLQVMPLAAVLAACSTLPPMSRAASPTASFDTRWICDRGNDCTLATPAADGDALLLKAIGNDPATVTFARHVGTLETAITREPMIAGNEVTLLIDGPATHDAQIAAIEQARHHVHLDVYILTDEKIGQRYAVALKQRAAAGVKVRVIFDSIGGLDASNAFLDGLRDSGVELFEFNKTNPIRDPRLWRINRRHHRKLLIVDGNVAFTGGINITDEYRRASPGSGGRSGSSSGGRSGSGSKGAARDAGWRDTHIRVRGPAVAAFQQTFVASWQAAKGPIEKHPAYYPELAAVGPDLVRVLTNKGADFLQALLEVPESVGREVLQKPSKESSEIYLSYLAVFREAQQRIWITQAYFVPDRALIKQLRHAAQRGVDVRILMPAKSDVGLIPLASRSSYHTLLKAGVKLYEYQPVMMHAKTAVVDGVWSTVGSSNLDFRSFLHNDEANAVIMGKSFASEMEQLFEKDLQQSQQITLAEWRARPWLDRLKEQGAALLKYWI